MIRAIYHEGYRLARIGVQARIACTIYPSHAQVIRAAYDSLYHRSDFWIVTTQFQYKVFCGRYVSLLTDITLLAKFKPEWGMAYVDSHDLTDYKNLKAPT